MIILKKPDNGAKLNLLTNEQREFLSVDRSDLYMENSQGFDYLNLKIQSSDDFSFPEKICFEWEADGECILHLSESENFDSFISFSGNGFCEAENLLCGMRYFWRVISGDEISDVFYFDTEDTYPRPVRIDGVSNVRDLGGKTTDGRKISQGLIYRGSELNSNLNITDEGRKTMLETLKVKTVLDLRGGKEIVINAYGQNYKNIPSLAYKEWLGQPEVAKEIFEFMFDEDIYPVYFHCAGGADRTGTLAFLLGAILGKSYEDLIDDYEFTTLSRFGARSRNDEEIFGIFYKTFDSFEGDTIKEKAETYFKSCGISDSAIEKFRKFMLR